MESLGLATIVVTCITNPKLSFVNLVARVKFTWTKEKRCRQREFKLVYTSTAKVSDLAE